MKGNFSLAIHGGAGNIKKENFTRERENEYRSFLNDTLEYGFNMLSNGEKAIDVVESVVIRMEDNPLFNAGKGSVLSADGKYKLDAAIMNGKDLSAGAVAGVEGISNPVRLARTVLEKSPFVFLVGEGAVEFAKTQGMKTVPQDYFFTEFRFKQWEKLKHSKQTSLDHGSAKKFGTVGAVALDKYGDLCAATSTGGMINKRFDRIGDSPLIGAGVYANNNICAVSSTGHGEFFIKTIAAYDISCLMEYSGLSLEKASRLVVNTKLKKMGGEGGVIAIDKDGNISMIFNSSGMYRGSVDQNAHFTTAIFRNE